MRAVYCVTAWTDYEGSDSWLVIATDEEDACDKVRAFGVDLDSPCSKFDNYSAAPVDMKALAKGEVIPL